MQFPDRHELEHLAATPTKVAIPGAGEIPADGWTVESNDSTRPRGSAARPDDAPSSPFAVEVVKALSQSKRHAQWSSALACVARETGRFYLRQGARAPEDLSRFIAGACGALAPQVGVGFVGGKLADTYTDEQVFRELQPKIGEFVRSVIPADATDAGAWFGRGGGNGVLFIAFTKSIARVETTSFQPDARGDVVIVGQIDEPFDHVIGYVNRGQFGVDPCFVDPSVRRPRFRTVCRVSSRDPSAWVQLLYVRPMRVLWTPFLQVLVRPNGAAPLAYQPDKLGQQPKTVAAPEQFTMAIVEGLNAVRRQIGYTPVRIAAEQSKTAALVATPYFSSAISSPQSDVPDRIALGLMAGWQVSGTIRDGRFVSSIVPSTHDATRWLASTLATPLGRATLLAPEIQELAFGPLVLSNPDALGAVVTSYRLYGAEDHSRDVDAVYERIIAARDARSLEKPARLAGMNTALKRELGRVQRGESEPLESLNTVLREGVNRFGAGMRGVVIEATSVDAVEIPEELLRAPHLFLEVGVTHHKPEGAAWGQLVIMIVYTDPQELRASHEPAAARSVVASSHGAAVR